jgi:hypothetical protein
VGGALAAAAAGAWLAADGIGAEVRRRALLAGALAAAAARAEAPAPILLLRHAMAPGGGDPPGFRLDDLRHPAQSERRGARAGPTHRPPTRRLRRADRLDLPLVPLPRDRRTGFSRPPPATSRPSGPSSRHPLLQATEKEAIKRGDQFIASEMFLLALADSKGDHRQCWPVANGLTRKSLEAAIEAVRGGQGVDSAEAEGQREALKKYTST